MFLSKQTSPLERGALLHPGWTLILPLLAITVLIASPVERRLSMVLASTAIFALTQWLLPGCRFRVEHYFSPVNLVLFLMLLKLVIAPIFVMAAGTGSELYVAMPTQGSMEAAILIDLIAYLALCLGLSFTPRGRIASRSLFTVLSETPGPTVAVVFAAIGAVGFVLAFGSPGRMMEYFLEPSAITELQHEYAGNWSGFLGVVLRPFIAFALVAWWSRRVDQSVGPVSWRWAMVRGIIAAIGITIANLTFSFNRAAFIFPVISLVAVYDARSRRIPPLATACALAIFLPCWFAIGNYRASMMAGAEASSAKVLPASLRDVSETVLAYSGGPPLAGLFLNEVGWGSHLYGGSTLVASVLSPVPILGKSFRESSGSTLYNRTLYGVPGFEDQLIPFSSELFVNFHALGVLAGFFGLGMLLGRAELWFSAVGSSFGAFCIQYVSMWGAMMAVWSVGVFSQIAIYFFGPIYLYWAAVQARLWLRGMRTHEVAISLS
jgi:hypothetical protein